MHFSSGYSTIRRGSQRACNRLNRTKKADEVGHARLCLARVCKLVEWARSSLSGVQVTAHLGQAQFTDLEPLTSTSTRSKPAHRRVINLTPTSDKILITCSISNNTGQASSNQQLMIEQGIPTKEDNSMSSRAASASASTCFLNLTSLVQVSFTKILTTSQPSASFAVEISSLA